MWFSDAMDGHSTARRAAPGRDRVATGGGTQHRGTGRRGPLWALLVATATIETFAPPPSSAAERGLTLLQAVDLALQKNEQITIERESLTAAEAAVSGARGAHDPLLGLGASWESATPPVNSLFSGAPAGQDAPNTDTADVGAALRQLLSTGGSVAFSVDTSRTRTDGAFALLSPAWGTQLGLELRQPLLRNRNIDSARLGIRVTSAGQTGAVASLRLVVTETVAAVERAYWRLVAARRAVGVEEEAVRLADEQLEETRIRISKGAAPQTEIAQPRAELERRRGDLLAVQEASSRAENALKSLILDDSSDLWLERLMPVEETPPAAAVPDLTAALDRALNSRPELEIAAATLTQRKAEAAFAENGVLPSLDAVVAYNRFGLAGSQNPAASAIPGLPVTVPAGMDGGLGRSWGILKDGAFSDTRIGLTLDIPIGNHQARAAAVTATAAVRQSEAALASARKSVRAEVLNAAAGLETAKGRVESAKAAREAAEIQLAAEKDRYAAGLSTNFLVLTRQNDLSRARLGEIDALTDLRTARTELARATGSLLQERGIDVAKPPRGVSTTQ